METAYELGAADIVKRADELLAKEQAMSTLMDSQPLDGSEAVNVIKLPRTPDAYREQKASCTAKVEPHPPCAASTSSYFAAKYWLITYIQQHATATGFPTRFLVVI
ncbi:hypothetical protein Ct61P_09204 [Colletotrichum tofieldiae]|nr:hypothetical protein Ct61P_09204 [Colletotrichum tofieldiae]